MSASGYARVLFTCSELYPLIKTGGLADVCAALPRALAREGVDVRLMLPAYPCALAVVEGPHEILQLTDGGRILCARVPDSRLLIYLFDQPDLFSRVGNPYQDEHGTDWPDNHRRFAAFCHACTILALHGDGAGWAPDVVHAHDWHTALLPALLSLHAEPHPPSVLTIHNLSYQGNFPIQTAAEARLRAELLRNNIAEFHGQVSFLKAGIRTADRLTTVSPTYAREILTPEHGAGLDSVLRTRAADLVGILNGVDTDIWNPAIDPYLSHRYTARDPDGKRACKAALQVELGFDPAPDVPLVCFVNRLSHQKMADVVLDVLPALAARHIQFALLGDGDNGLEVAFAAAGQAPNIAVCVGYREDLAHRITAGVDISLIPSRFEPCGLTALYAMRYGTLPVSRRIGGLADSVMDAGDAASPHGGATGFCFAEASSESLLSGLDRACAWFADRSAWHELRRTAMQRDLSWDTAARQYLKLYQQLLPDHEADDTTPLRRRA